MPNNLKVLLLGSGGREHALVEAILRSSVLGELMVAPGNAGTEPYNVDLKVDDHQGVADYCLAEAVDLVVVGPEAPLVAGLADVLVGRGIKCFGPSAAAACLEGSKAFARTFADRYGIPGPEYRSFTDSDEAISWFEDFGRPVVVKADGLAGGKGVLLPEGRSETHAAIRELLDGGSMGEAATEILLEERMEGEEVSLFGLCSADQIDPLGGLTAQDHKRVGEGDTGLNTGGMGAFAPVPGLDASFVDELVLKFLEPVRAGMVEEGMPYVGVVYAGLMLTSDGPKLVEYNCRFGDPEAQVLLPLVNSDLLEALYAAASGETWVPVEISSGVTAATVVVAADGYPTAPVSGVKFDIWPLAANRSVFHAGTSVEGGVTTSVGGRVLAVTATGPDLGHALEGSYQVVDKLVSESDGKLFARPDIGWRHHERAKADAYSSAGVSFTAGDEAIEQIADAVKATHTDRVVAGVGSFGGVFDPSGLGMDDGFLVSSTDTCGTKTVLAAELDSWEGFDSWKGIGADIVNHGVNDVLVQGARPLFMLDTISAGRLSPDIVGRVVRAMAAACVETRCVLLGGETAEVPDLILPEGVDVAGTMVGLVAKADLLPRDNVADGDLLVGLVSNGLHTNGYSLARKVGSSFGYENLVPDTNITLGEALLVPHRCYLEPLRHVLSQDAAKALAHITGGGFVDNIPRCLPDGLGAEVDTTTWETPPLFNLLQSQAGIGLEEAHRIFNMGIGMVAVIDPDGLAEFQALVSEPTFVVGKVTASEGVTIS